MKPLTREWVKKAEGDFAVMQREARARGKPVYDVICFHAQQCAEKYLKARLQEAVQPFSKTHDLPGLLQVLLPLEPGVHVSKCTRQSVPRASRPPLPSDSASLPRAGGTPAVHLLTCTLEPALKSLGPALRVLNRYAVAFRYPGVSASRLQARAAAAHCRQVRAALRQTLGFKCQPNPRQRRRR